MAIKAADISLIDKIFADKNWNRTEKIYQHAYENTLSIISELNDNEKNLFIKLLTNFRRYPSNIYEDLLHDASKKIPASALDGFTKIIFVPIKFPMNTPRAKSCDQFPYTMRTAVAPHVDTFQGKCTSSLSSALELKTINPDTMIIALDDYIGSGRTALNFHKELTSRLPHANNQIILLSLVNMQFAENYLRSKGIKVYSAITEKKCISQNPDFPNPKETLATLKSISQKLKTRIFLYRGYSKSEALVAMMNTPNNTIPIFWADSATWSAPFRRIR